MMLQDSELFDLKNPSCFESFIFWLVVTGTVDFFWLSIYWECHHPNWLICQLIFFRWVGIPPTSCFFYDWEDDAYSSRWSSQVVGWASVDDPLTPQCCFSCVWHWEACSESWSNNIPQIHMMDIWLSHWLNDFALCSSACLYWSSHVCFSKYLSSQPAWMEASQKSPSGL